MARVRLHRFFGPVAIVNFLVDVASGDAVIFDARKFADAMRAGVWEKIIERAITSDVSIKIAIRRIARIPFLRTPDLAAGIAVAGKGCRAGRRVTRREDCATRPRLREEQTVGVENA